tara:strand:+ start:48 stop:356 length:309 start_codon:yes stop_codon:yes gene_type:complete
MATDLRDVSTYPHFKTIIVTTDAEEIQLPSQCSQFTAGSSSSAIFIAQNGASDGAAMPADKQPVPAGNAMSLVIGRGESRAQSMFVSSQAGSASVVIVLEEL